MTLHIAIGGGLGALARFAMGAWVMTWTGGGFPWGTFAVNVTGSTLLGFLLGRLSRTTATPELRAGLTIGFCGGFTTFSTFDHETFLLLQQGAWGMALSYSAGTVVVCLGGVLLGLALGRGRGVEAA